MALNSEHEESDSLIIDRREDRSFLMLLLQSLIKPFRPRLTKVSEPSHAGSRRLTPPCKKLRQHEVHERHVEHVWIYDVTFRGKSLESSSLRRIYYFAGGGWQMPPSAQHWALVAALAQRLANTIVSVVSYPLAPDNPASVSMPQLQRLYRVLMEQSGRQGERVVFAGDSAGGNVALSLVLWCSEASSEDEAALHHVPDAVFAISPSTDLRHEDANIGVFAKRDPILTPDSIKSTAAAWCKGGASQAESHDWTASDGRVSPILGPLEQFANKGISVHGVIGTADVLAPEALVFMERCRELRVRGRWLVWEKQMHCFPLAFTYGLPECIESLDWIVQVLSHG
ncbi:hypothetical protein CDD81_3846 [Ophiocordyceps australis]|uniref:Alpha/beta hydrolase fold-3 domain-containing protein n=1 Tax=Ophiocordyceps australis TaxID=1399860 RepID=A0A2C5XWP5_9HYPO|nr:hypothetical protein CDD81_3846 [Ophiocordyceps australis]